MVSSRHEVNTAVFLRKGAIAVNKVPEPWDFEIASPRVEVVHIHHMPENCRLLGACFGEVTKRGGFCKEFLPNSSTITWHGSVCSLLYTTKVRLHGLLGYYMNISLLFVV